MKTNVMLGTCPVCNGTGELPLTDEQRKYSWNAGKTHGPCDNCGGQYMYGKSTGKVRLRKDNGEPCVHQYKHESLGRCYHGYTCKHCGDYFTVDSGD